MTQINESIFDKVLDALSTHPDVQMYMATINKNKLDSDHAEYDEEYERTHYNRLNKIHRDILTPMFFEKL